MVKWIRRETKKQQNKELWGRDFTTVENEPDVGQVDRSLDDLPGQYKASSGSSPKRAIVSLKTALETAMADAEQMTTSIKLKAQTEAEAEATAIISQAESEAQEIKRRAATAGEREAEDIISEANKKAGITEAATRQKASQFLLRVRGDIAGEIKEGQDIEEELAGEKIEEPIQLQEELLEQHHVEEKLDKEEDESTPLEVDSQAPYTGEVELEIPAPVNPKMVYKLYDYLQTIPELRILYTRGSWDRGTVIAVMLDQPMPIVNLLSEMAGVQVMQLLSQKDSLVEKIPNPLLGMRRKEATILKLRLKDEQAP